MATKGATPKIMARTSRDSAGYFLTIVDIFAPFFSLIGIEILDLQNFGSPCDGFPIKGMIFSNIKQEKVF
jgi:hypothetical protein